MNTHESLHHAFAAMGRLQGKKRLLEQSTEDSGFHLEDGPVDGNDLANKSKLALVVQDAGDLIEARLLHEEVGYFRELHRLCAKRVACWSKMRGPCLNLGDDRRLSPRALLSLERNTWTRSR